VTLISFTDNEIDGFTLLHLGEEDVFRTMPDKVGPARKILTFIQREQEKFKEIQNSNVLEFKGATCKTPQPVDLR
jgi:hypothetical protein